MTHKNRTARLAELFQAWPGRWFDGRELAEVGGQYAWRTRVSEARRGPHSLNIENRQRRLANGEIRSEYRLAPPTESTTTTTPATATEAEPCRIV